MNRYAPERGESFAAALALMADGDTQPDQAAERRQEERDELMRRACLSALQRAENNPHPELLDQAYLAWARDFVATHPPLQRPLGTWEPAA